MFDSGYMAIGRYCEGVSVLGYMLRNGSTGETKLYSREYVEELALTRQIGNIYAQNYKGKVILKGVDCRLTELPNYDKYGNMISQAVPNGERHEAIIVSGRVMEGKTTIGYVVSLICNGVTVGKKTLRKDKVIELARTGHIANMRVQMSNGNAVLRGHNCELAKLPIYKSKLEISSQAKKMTKLLREVVTTA